MEGIEARMRVSSVMLPASSWGTLRSARMNTRLPETSRSVSFLTCMMMFFEKLWKSTTNAPSGGALDGQLITGVHEGAGRVEHAAE